MKLLGRRNLFIGAAAIAACAPASLLWRKAEADEPDPTEGRSIVWEDSFRELDLSVWSPGPKSTTDEPGFYGRSAFARAGGEEGFNPYAIVRDVDATGGTALQISAKHIGRPMNVPNYYGNSDPEFQWVSGNIQTAKRDGAILKGWRRGYFEARMRFPEHPLTWPAFWMLNGRSILDPATSVELDVVEHKGFEPTLYGAYLHEHGQPDENHLSSAVRTPVDMTKGYCRYGMLVDGDYCAPYFERKLVISSKTGQPAIWKIGRSAQLDANQDVFWPLLTLALRADYKYPDPLLEAHKMAHMRVDYFRVYSA